jgi:hypothetical protein
MSDEKTMWEEVARDPLTLRLRVTGGWLYNVVSLSDSGQQYQYSVVYVPDPPGVEP